MKKCLRLPLKWNHIIKGCLRMKVYANTHTHGREHTLEWKEMMLNPDRDKEECIFVHEK